MALTTQERLAVVRRELEYWSKCEAQAMAKVDEANRRIAELEEMEERERTAAE